MNFTGMECCHPKFLPFFFSFCSLLSCSPVQAQRSWNTTTVSSDAWTAGYWEFRCHHTTCNSFRFFQVIFASASISHFKMFLTTLVILIIIINCNKYVEFMNLNWGLKYCQCKQTLPLLELPTWAVAREIPEKFRPGRDLNPELCDAGAGACSTSYSTGCIKWIFIMFKIVLNMKLFIFLQESLLELLLSLYKLTDDPQLFLLAGKIILYYAENELVREIYSHILLPYSYTCHIF